jgi:hypothetical protein
MKKINEKEKKFGLAHQIKLTHQTYNLCNKSLITKLKKFNINKLNQAKKIH